MYTHSIRQFDQCAIFFSFVRIVSDCGFSVSEVLPFFQFCLHRRSFFSLFRHFSLHLVRKYALYKLINFIPFEKAIAFLLQLTHNGTECDSKHFHSKMMQPKMTIKIEYYFGFNKPVLRRWDAMHCVM